MTHLCELAEKWGTDKAPSGHDYTPVYDSLFDDRNAVLRVLEIGVGEPQPGKAAAPSLRMWEEYFPNAEIFSADSNPQWFVKGEGRIQPTIFCDQGNHLSLHQLATQVRSVDFIVDDGSHATEDQFLSLNVLLPLIRPGGWYVIEDVWETSPWDGKSVKELLGRITDILSPGFVLSYVRTGDRDSSLIIVKRAA